MPEREIHPGWGESPWTIDFAPARQEPPREADYVVVGGGFAGLAAAAWLRKLAPDRQVVLLEAGRLGAGASGRTGGIALAETAAGDFPGLGDVLGGFRKILGDLEVDGELALPGAWEIGRMDARKNSSIDWNDSGRLRAVREVEGGTVDPGKLVGGLGRAASREGATIVEDCTVEELEWGERPRLVVRRRGNGGIEKVSAGKILLATNALSLDLTSPADGVHPRLTLAATTEPIEEERLRAAGLAGRKPFYTVDLPYLWGRVMADNSVLWGAGLVSARDERHLETVRVDDAEARGMFAALEKRVRGLHPALAEVRFARRWGGPILFRDSWRPIFDWHPQARKARNGIVLGAFAGHGVALTSYLAKWAAEALVAGRSLPAWAKV